MNRIILTSLALLFVINHYAQDIRKSSSTSFYTYIYRLTENQAGKIYRKNMDKIDETYFTQLIDSFETGKNYRKILPTGHYLYAHTLKNKLELDINSVNNVNISILNNNRDLNIVVYDTLGTSITEASVKIGHKRIEFNKKAQTYLLPYSNKDGLLQVMYHGHTNYFNIEAQKKSSKFKTVTNTILYKSPVKFVAVPVRMVIYAPYDLYRSIRYRNAIGIYYYLWKPLGDPIRSVSNGEPYGYVKSISKLFGMHSGGGNGYIVFNKPKYRQGDTVFFKAWLYDGNNKPLKDSLEVEVFSGTYKKLGWVKPYRPGGYSFHFIASPTLGLKLDKNYSITLKKKRTRYIYGTFRYEEYELKSTSYTFRTGKADYHYKEPVTFYCQGTDENGLTLPDARVELVMLTKNVEKYSQTRMFVPDTLWIHKQNLDPTGDTKIIVPDSVLPEAKITATVEASFLNTNNELVKKNVTLTKDNEKRQITFSLIDDTIVIKYFYRGTEQKNEARMDIGELTENKIIKLPHKERINPFADSYYVVTDSTFEFFDVEDESANVQCFSQRNADSVWFTINNPRNLPLTYTVFKKNKPIFRGNNTKLKFSCKSTTPENYSASVQYIWAGKVKTEEYIIPFREKQLNIRVIQPPVIYPGQKTTIKLAVTDAYGKPAANADITGFGFTKKFGTNSGTSLPYMGKKYQNRYIFSNFSSNDDFDQLSGNRQLDYNLWRKHFNLDSIELYKFLFPQTGYYINTFERFDPDFAEISPFLVDKLGNPMPINIVYIDGSPVYYSFTTNNKPYVFRVIQGFHTIKIRSRELEVTLTGIFFYKKTKTVISINPYIANPKFTVEKRTPFYSKLEKQIILQSTMALKTNYYNFSYLQQGNYYEITESKKYRYDHRNILGPFQSGSIKYNAPGYFNVVTEFESGYEYEFIPGLVKMRAWGSQFSSKHRLEYDIPSQSFNDSVYTLQDILYLWDLSLKKKQSVMPVQNQPSNTNKGNGTLVVEYKPDTITTQLQAKNILLFSIPDTSMFRIYSGQEKNMYNIKPGLYRIELITFNNELVIADSILIKPNGKNYCSFNARNRMANNWNIEKMDDLIREHLFRTNYEVHCPKFTFENQNAIHELARQNRIITYNGSNFITGKIYDQSTNEILPGVNIFIEGTRTGTCSDINGEFKISKPEGNCNLLFSFVGYETVRLNLNQGADIRIALTPDIKELSEVVVVGYGVQRKASVVGSISQLNAVQGRVAGVDVKECTGSIFVRGTNTIQGKSQQLIIIDGIPMDASGINIESGDILSIETLKDTEAIALYGTKAIYGAILITTKNQSGNSMLKKLMQNKEYMEGVSQSKALRNHFSDCAFWKPDLVTDKNGIASFNVTFPDDITSWKTFYLVMGNNNTSGEAEGEIKAFKPISSSLALPRFLVKGDKSNLIGKALNYTNDSIEVKTLFDIDGTNKYMKQGKILTSRIDTFSLTVNTRDSVKVKYELTKNDGYTDGEERYIPIFPVGTIETKGIFHNLTTDSTIVIPCDKTMGKITIHAESDIIKLLLGELRQLGNYQHYCNEQLSSKLKALLMERTIFTLLEKKFPHDEHIRKIIKMLEGRRNAGGLWGWYQNGQTSWWITLHASEAIKKAEKVGFNNSINFAPMAALINLEYPKMNNRDKIRAVKMLKTIDKTPDYKNLVEQIKINYKDTVSRYELWELEQLCGLTYPLDSLLKEKKSTQMGNWYWGTERFSLFDDAISATLIAYRILHNENGFENELRKIRNYMLERKGVSQWRNTWETCRILETILPDLVSNNELNLKPELHFSGAFNQKVDSFPFTKEFLPGDSIVIKKKSIAPVYLTAYQQYFNENPEKVSKDFVVRTYFENNDTLLHAGKPIKLKVDVTVKNASEYVMIEIPIPAGCSYQEKRNFVWGEDYREYFKEKVCIYISRMGQRNYTFDVNLLPRYNGVYHLNPAKAELMYFPVFYGREGIKKVKIGN